MAIDEKNKLRPDYNPSWENLRPDLRTPFDGSEKHREVSRKAGIASGIAKRQRKTLRESLLKALSEEFTNKDGNKITVQDDIVCALLKKAKSGSVKAFETVRDTVGEKIRDEKHVIVEQSSELSVNLDLVKAMEKHFNETDK